MLVAPGAGVLAQPPAGADRGRPRVSVDGKPAASAAQRVRAGQRIAIDLLPTEESRAFRPEAAAAGRASSRTTHLLVIDKPAGLVVHPAAGNWSGTLLNGLLVAIRGSAALPRAGIVHRLDKDTSGLMVVGKTLAGGDGAGARDRRRARSSRRYLAIVHGKAPAAPFSVEAPIGRDPQIARAHGRRRLGQAGADRRRAARHATTRCSAAALHPAHRAHAPDPRAPGVARPSAGRRRALRRPAGRWAWRGRRCMPPSWRSRIRCRDGRSPSPRRLPADLAPAWRQLAGSRGLKAGRRHRLQSRANRFDAIPPARRDPAAARAIDETHRDPIAPECASRRPASACAPDPPRSRRDDMPPGDAAEDDHEDMKTLDAKRVLETALICATQPMSLREMRRAVRRRDRHRHPARPARRAGPRVRRQRRRTGRSWRAAGASRAGRRCATTSTA